MAINKPLQVGFLLDTSLDPDDGVQQYILSLGAWMSRQGHNVSYLVGETKNRQAPNIYSLARNFTVTFNGNKTTVPLPASNNKIRTFLKDHKFDVIHVQSPHSPFFSQKIIKYAPKDTVIIGTFHILPYGKLASNGNHLLATALRTSLKKIDKMLAVSVSARDFCKKSFGLEAEVLPNVIDYKRFNDAAPLAKFNNQKINILFLGRLVKRKGCQTLIRAISLLDDGTKSKIRVIICGKGELYEDLNKLVNSTGLEEIVTFEGYVSESDKPSYYSSADIAVFPSVSGESFGIVLLEAMASGNAAVLAGDNPGYSTVMNPKRELLFDPKSPTELSSLIKKYIDNKTLRQEIAAWAEEYTKNFDVNIVGSKLVNIYHQEIAKKKSLKDN